MAVKAAVAATAEVNFGDMAMYTMGSSVPEGNYALEFLVQNEPDSDYNKNRQKRIGVLVTAHSISDPADIKAKFLSMGSKTHEVFAPNPDTGKGLVLRAGVQGGGTIPSSCNWGLFLKSMYDSGLPQGIFTNDLSVLDGVHAHLANIPESEERKGFKPRKAATSEVEEEPKFEGSGTTLAVTEILEGGAPWEGGGGIPEAAATKPVAVTVKAAAKPNGKVAPAKPAAKTAAPATVPSDDDVMEAAINGVTAVLEKNPNGVGKMILKMGTFKSVTATVGDEIAQAVQSLINNDENLGMVIEQLGYKLEGQKIVPATA